MIPIYEPYEQLDALIKKKLTLKDENTGAQVEITAIERPDGSYVINLPSYEVLTDCLKTKIINAVELQMPDAYQRVQEIFSRKIRTQNTITVRTTPPEGAKGMYVEYYVLQSSGGKSKLVVRGGSGRATTQSMRVETNEVSDNFRSELILWYPNAHKGDLDSSVLGVKTVGIPVPRFLDFQILIDGTFNENEGIDSLVEVEWLI